MWLNSIKKKSDPSNNTASQHQSINRASIKLTKTSSQFNEELTEMTEISKSSYHSAKNMEKLTVIIAALTIASVVISLMGLTISSVNVSSLSSSELTVNIAWALGVLVTVICVLIVAIVLERGEYMPKNPHLSNIRRYNKYCRSRFGSSIVIYILLYLFGIIFAFTSFITCITDDFSVIMRTNWLWATIISLGLLTGIILGIWIYHKYRLHLIYFSGLTPLIITLLIWGAYTNPIISAIQHPLNQILLVYWVCVCLISIYKRISINSFFNENHYL